MTIAPTDNTSPRDQSPGSEYIDFAMRIGLASHPRFSGAIHQRLVMDCLYEVPTQQLDVPEIISGISVRFDGIVLTTGQCKTALEQLQRDQWITEVRRGKGGAPQFRLSGKGIDDWMAARSEGFSLEQRVRTQFFEGVGIESKSASADARWRSLLDDLDALFKREAFEIATAFIDRGKMPAFLLESEGALSDLSGREDLGAFLRTASGDRLVFLRRLFNSTLALYLFRASPDVDEAVRRHLKNRTFYLDTTVLYSLLAQYGEIASLKNDLVRLTSQLGCKLRVTTDTLREFQESVAHYKRLLEQTGITDAVMAERLLPEYLLEMDDFRRGFYQALFRDRAINIDTYALAYETIEEQLHEWGIPRPIELSGQGQKDAAGNWIEIEDVEEYALSIENYLARHPRQTKAADWIEEKLARHDALHIAWIQRERALKNIAVPVKPSQVDVWFLTRDRRLLSWDLDYIKTNGLGRVPRCLSLQDWIEGIAMLVPSIGESDAATALAMRELVLTCPSLPAEAQLNSQNVQEIGRVAQNLELHPEEAARVVADRQLAADLAVTQSAFDRAKLIKAGVLRLKEAELHRATGTAEAAMRELESTKKELHETKGQLERTSGNLKQTENALAAGQHDVQAMEADAKMGRLLRERGPIVVALLVGVAFLATVAKVPVLWADALWPRRILVCALGVCLVLVTGLVATGKRTHAIKVILISAGVAGFLEAMVEFWHLTERPTRPASTTSVRSDTSPRAPVDAKSTPHSTNQIRGATTAATAPLPAKPNADQR